MNNWLSNFYERKPEYRKLRVAKRTPDAIHFELERGLYEAHIFIDRRFERSMAGLWIPKSGLTDAVRMARKLIRNPQAALYFVAALPFLTTLMLQPDATDGLDNYLNSRLLSQNNGTSVTLSIGKRSVNTDVFRTLIKLDFSSILSVAQIQSATSSLFATADDSANATVYRVYRQKRAWSESQSTWTIYVTGNGWQTAGGFGANDCEQTDIGSLPFSATETLNVFKDFALTPSAVQQMITGGSFTNNGFLIKADEETVASSYNFASSDNTTAANRPKSVIVYTVPSDNVFHPAFSSAFRSGFN